MNSWRSSGADAPRRGRTGRSVAALVATVGVDLFVDGFLIGLGFAEQARTGVFLTIALSIEVAFLGIAATAKATRREALARLSGFAVLLVAGAAAGSLLGGALSGDAMEAALAFGCAALLYLVAEELLVEAQEVPETPLSGAMLSFGFLAILILDMLA